MNNKAYVFFFLLLLLIGVYYVYNKYQKAPSIQFSQLPLLTLQNEKFDLQSLKGKKLVICMAASWCPNCIDELNELALLKPQSLTDVEVLVISDESLEKIEQFKTRRNYPFTFIKLNTNFAAIGINSIPTSYIINKNFEVVKQSVGIIQWSDPSTLQHLKTLMD